MSASSREKPLTEAIASSLTELFAPGIIKERVTGMLADYDFIDEETLSYFRRGSTRRRAMRNSRSPT